MPWKCFFLRWYFSVVLFVKAFKYARVEIFAEIFYSHFFPFLIKFKSMYTLFSECRNSNWYCKENEQKCVKKQAQRFFISFELAESQISCSWISATKASVNSFDIIIFISILLRAFFLLTLTFLSSGCFNSLLVRSKLKETRAFAKVPRKSF